MGAALFVLALMDNLQRVFTNASHELLLAAVGGKADFEFALTLRSRCMSHLQQVFQYLCRAVAARVYDPLEVQEGKISKVVQVGSPTLMLTYLGEYFWSQLRRDLTSMPANDTHL